MKDIEGEVWVSIFREYEISNMGRVRSLKRAVPIVMKQYPNNRGYLLVHFRIAGGRIARTVHRLVADIFLKNTDPKKTTVNHDLDKSDNRASSLSWMTQSDNSTHGVINGLLPRGEDSYLAKLDETQVRTIKSIGSYLTQKEMADYFRVSRSVIQCILQGKTWKHVSV